MSEKLTVLTQESGDIGKTCTRCGEPFEVGDEVVHCPRCRGPHHLECWKDNGGCATRGCPQVAEVYKSEKILAGRDELVKPKQDTRKYVIAGVLAVILLLSYHFFGPKPPNPAEGKIALDFMIEGSAREQVLYDEIVQAFNESQDEIYVFSSTVPPGGYDQKLLVMIGARDAPDIFSLRFDRFDIFAENEALLPLDEFLGDSPPVLDRLGSRIEQATLPDGRVMGLPHPGLPWILTVSSQTQNPDEAWRFLEYLVLELDSKWPEDWVVPDDAPMSPAPIIPGF